MILKLGFRVTKIISLNLEVVKSQVKIILVE